MIPTRLFYFVNGINVDAEDHARNWHNRAERWIENKRRGLADSHPYEMLPGARWRKQKGVVENLYASLKDREGYDQLILVGHSNGAQVICDLLAAHEDIVANQVHLVAGACDASFVKNGLNAAIERGQIGEVWVWYSTSDRALKAAWYTRWIPFLGYGSLGLHGPRDLRLISKMVTEPINCTPFGHSTYFETGNFERLMGMIAPELREEG